MLRGFNSLSKNISFQVHAFTILSGGGPSASIIHMNYYLSFSPANKGNPTNSSYAIHPKDQISIAVEYGIPRITSGAQ